MTAGYVSRFAALTPGGEVPDLARAAFALAWAETPDLDLAVGEARLDALAAALRARLEPGADLRARLGALRRLLFDELRLRGNAEEYDDPKNSYLHEVLRRGLGLPISLSVLTVEVGRRAGLPVLGVGFPGHFLVRGDGPEGTVILDPFGGGRELRRETLEALRARVAGPAAPPLSALLAPTPPRAILARMLRNLARAHLGRGEKDLARGSLDRLLHLEPQALDARRDRGLLRLELGDFAGAAADLAEWLARAAGDPAEREVRRALNQARQRLAASLS